MTNDVHVAAMRDVPRECANCDSTSLHLSCEVQAFPYGQDDAQVMLSAKVPVWTCGNCGEQFTNSVAEELRHEAVCRHLGRMTPAELRDLRGRYGDSQEEWHKRTGIGLASIKRWEAGSLIQNEAMDLFLWLLNDRNIGQRLLLRNDQPPSSGSARRFRTTMPEEVERRAGIFELHTTTVIRRRA